MRNLLQAPSKSPWTLALAVVPMLRKDSEFPYLVCTNTREQVLCPGREDYTASTSALRLFTNKEVTEYFPIRGIQLQILHPRQFQLRRRRYILLIKKLTRGKTRHMLHFPRRDPYFSD